MSEHFSFLLPAFDSSFWCCHNGTPPVIWIISLYPWYQVYFMIIIVEFLVTDLSITYFKTNLSFYWSFIIYYDLRNCTLHVYHCLCLLVLGLEILFVAVVRTIIGGCKAKPNYLCTILLSLSHWTKWVVRWHVVLFKATAPRQQCHNVA